MKNLRTEIIHSTANKYVHFSSKVNAYNSEDLFLVK